MACGHCSSREFRLASHSEVICAEQMALTSAIQAYQADWARRYTEEAGRLTPIFGGALLALHHVGSTAVPGLAAKPEIDILAFIGIEIVPDAWLNSFAYLGYRRGGDLSPGHRFFKRDVDGIRTHKLHVCGPDHPTAHRMLRFRDHLRLHPADRAEYEALKRKLEQENTAGISEYLAAKAPFIDAMMERIGHRSRQSEDQQ